MFRLSSRSDIVALNIFKTCRTLGSKSAGRCAPLPPPVVLSQRSLGGRMQAPSSSCIGLWDPLGKKVQCETSGRPVRFSEHPGMRRGSDRRSRPESILGVQCQMLSVKWSEVCQSQRTLRWSSSPQKFRAHSVAPRSRFPTAPAWDCQLHRRLSRGQGMILRYL
jgi:hypothetical protein